MVPPNDNAPFANIINDLAMEGKDEEEQDDEEEQEDEEEEEKEEDGNNPKPESKAKAELEATATPQAPAPVVADGAKGFDLETAALMLCARAVDAKYRCGGKLDGWSLVYGDGDSLLVGRLTD